MNIEQFKEALPFLIKAEIPAMLVGHHGVGKTEGTRQYAEANGYMMKILNLGTQDVGDIIGLADFKKDKNGQNVATKFMPPDWATDLFDYCNKNPDKIGILFLDELNRARRDVLQVIFPLLLEKRMHTMQFPSNFYVQAAMNPNTDNYIVTDISDKALLDRFCHIKMAPSKQEFFKYSKSTGFDEQLLQFLQDQPKLLSAELEAFDLDVTPSRRSWHSVNKLVKLKPPQHILQQLSYGLVGVEATTAMMKALSDGDKPISANDIFSTYPKFQKKIKEYSGTGAENKMSALKYTCDSILEMAQSRKDKLTKEESKNLADFLYDIPKDLSFSLCRDLYMEDLTRPTIDDHSELLTEIANKRGMKVKGINV